MLQLSRRDAKQLPLRPGRCSGSSRRLRRIPPAGPQFHELELSTCSTCGAAARTSAFIFEAFVPDRKVNVVVTIFPFLGFKQ